MKFISSMQRSHKTALGLLQIGTFLESFDLFLYIHMAVLLNESFFPPSDPNTKTLLTAFALCSSFLLSPLGALIFGTVGDRIGRKPTFVLTSMIMAITCITIASLPTYAEIGIIAAWIVTICRALQGMASLGEIMGSEVYLTETVPPPARYPAVAWVTAAAGFGACCAIGIATLVIKFGLNWRLTFLIGATVAVIGLIARYKLEETPEFIAIKKHLANIKLKSASTQFDNKKTSWQTILAFYFIHCGWPLVFYFAFLYCGSYVQKAFHYTGEQIVQQNFIVSIFALLSAIIFGTMSYTVPPLKIVRGRIIIIMPFILLMPFLLSMAKTPLHVLFLQCFCAFFGPTAMPANAIFITYFPTLKRFTYASFLYALSRSSIYIITSFGLVYPTTLYSHFGLWFVMLPIVTGMYWSISYFMALEQTQAVPKAAINFS